MPQAGQWRRLAVALNSFNFHWGSIDGVVVENYGGRVWWDHAGRSLGAGCAIESWQNRPNTRHNDDQLWIDEDFPAGAVVDAPGVTWTDRQRSSGELSFHYPNFDVLQPQHISVHDFAPVAIDPNGFLFAYVFQSQCNPPEQILLTWQTSAGPKSAYWGANPFNSTGIHVGPLPRLRAWERLEVPASLLGLQEGDTVTGFTSPRPSVRHRPEDQRQHVVHQHQLFDRRHEYGVVRPAAGLRQLRGRRRPRLLRPARSLQSAAAGRLQVRTA
jgi:hypothetical protein